MLSTNLSTRPFYNERVAYLALALGAALVVVLTIVDVVELQRLSALHSRLVTRVEQAETRAGRLRADAERARRSVDRKQLEKVAVRAREANALIDQRTFSWTEVLNRIETTLPPDLRIESIKPGTDRSGALTMVLVVVGRRAEDVEAFVEKLQKSGTFSRLYARTDTTTPQGLLEVTLEGQYAGAPRATTPEPRTAGKD